MTVLHLCPRTGAAWLMLDESIELNIAIAALKTKDKFIVKKVWHPLL